jgi:3-hydroxyisobutyrate dehydrogenase-like beta-hydroxyacid dehydrogenase
MDNSIGLIGLGLMGSAIAARLRESGFALMAFDIAPERNGGAREPAEVFRTARRVILSLPDHRAVAAVLESAPLHAGQIVIDMTTGDFESAARAARELSARGATYLDAPVSGSSEQMRAGEAVLFVGGEKSAFDRCGDLFAALGRTVLHTGPCGSAAQMKLVTNLVLGLNRAALAEGLAFAGAIGVEPAAALDAMRASMAYSRIMDTKGHKMLAADYTPQATLSQHLKDVRLILAAAAARVQRLPLTETHRTLLELAESLGCGPLDNSSILRAWESAP